MERGGIIVLPLLLLPLISSIFIITVWRLTYLRLLLLLLVAQKRKMHSIVAIACGFMH